MLQYHPHLHLIIPGGALSDNNDQWFSSRQDLFVHTKPLEVIFKAKFKDAMKKAGLLDKIDPAVWKRQWVIDSQAVGQGQNSLRYLSRYVFRVAISNNRIKSIENDVIKFVYKDRELISLIHDIIALFTKIPELEIPGIKCSHCGHDLKFLLFVKPEPRCKPG